MQQEFQTLTQLLERNEYSKRVIHNTTQKFLNKINSTATNAESDQPERNGDKPKLVFFKLQYIDRISLQIEREIREFLKLFNVKLIFSHRTLLWAICFRTKIGKVHCFPSVLFTN